MYEIPDNLDQFDQEQERRHRMLKRLAAAEEAADREEIKHE